MRLRWYKCEHTEITDVLNFIENLYDVELSDINIYFRLKKGDNFFSLYDMATLEEANILMSRDILINKRLENIVCFNKENIEIVKTVMSTIQNWNQTNRIRILNFLILKLGILSESQRNKYMVNDIQKIEEVAVLLFNSIGINPAQILMPIDRTDS